MEGGWRGSLESPDRFDNEETGSFEFMLRRLLLLPKHPAVILVNGYLWEQLLPVHDPGVGGSSYWRGNHERDLLEFASFYRLSSASVKVNQLSLSSASVRVSPYQVSCVRYSLNFIYSHILRYSNLVIWLYGPYKI